MNRGRGEYMNVITKAEFEAEWMTKSQQLCLVQLEAQMQVIKRHE